jgi:Mg-chelatase subunit ChlD
VTFTAPYFLLLLAGLPLIVWLGWPSRGESRGREAASLALRLLIALALILSLAGLEVVQPSDELAVVFLIDASDSVPQLAKAYSKLYVQQALQSMRQNDKAAIVVFGGDALVERPMSSGRELATFTSIPLTLATDIAEAIRLGLALYPPGAAKRMVILSDGIATTGDAEEAARLAAASGVQIVVVPFLADPNAAPAPEVLISQVDAPPHLRQGESFNLEVRLEATRAETVGLRVFAGSQVISEQNVDLKAGTNNLSLPLKAGESGFAAYRVQIVPAAGEDGFYQNNELAAFSQIEGPPRVLVVGETAGRDGVDELGALTGALEASGVAIDVVAPTGLPSELAALSEYASVVLVDVPAHDLTPRQMESLQTYVRDLGGGLVAVGGPSSYGVGGYFKTPLEETLPVEMQIKDEQRRARLTLVMVIDRSGSMSDSSGGAQKIELAKEAAIRSVELLNPGDRVGVVVFDDSASWVVPIQEIQDPSDIINRISTVRSGGGTDILAGVQAAAKALEPDPALLKHVVLMTDGQASPSGIPELVRAMHDQYGITLSAVAMGQDADTALLQQLAQIGEGRYHFAADPASVPSIFTEETSLATRAYIIEEPFFPQQVSVSTILSGIDSIPQLLGYVGTTAKDAAQTILESSHKDPILAAWQYGLGRSVAWTSDATGRWAKNWVTWADFPRFWAQTVRWTISEGAQDSVGATVRRVGEQAVVTVDAVTNQGDYLNGLTLEANVVNPAGDTQAVQLTQIAPGRYTGTFTPNTEGAYLIRIAGGDGAESVAQTAGWVLSYSPEYRSLQADPAAMLRLASLTGGHATTGDPAEAFAHTLQTRNATRPAWPWLLLLAAILLPFDVGVRRLVVSRRDVLNAGRRLAAWVRLTRPDAQAIPGRTEQLNALFKAKDRAVSEPVKEAEAEAEAAAPATASVETPPTPAPVPPATPAAEASPPSQKAAPPAAEAAPAAAEAKPAPPEEPKRDGQTKSGSTALASSLLARKKAREEEQKKEAG